MGIASETALQPFRGWPLAGEMACGSLTTPLYTSCHAPPSSMVSQGPIILYHSTPCSRLSPSQPIRHPKVGCPQTEFDVLGTNPVRGWLSAGHRVGVPRDTLHWGIYGLWKPSSSAPGYHPWSPRSHRRTAWGVQEARRRPQATCLAEGPPLKKPYGRFRSGLPTGFRRVRHGGPG
jgi:hypothetical protein